MVLIHIKRYQVCLACIIITINLIILHKSYVIFQSDHDVDLKISKKTRNAKIPQNKPPHFFTNPPTFDQIFNSSKSYPKNPDQIKVLIMAQWRGGSTLLSDVFRFNSRNSLYLYEPLIIRQIDDFDEVEGDRFTLTKKQYLAKREKYRNFHNKILEKIFSCKLLDYENFWLTDKYLKDLKYFNVERWKNLKYISQCREVGICAPKFSPDLFAGTEKSPGAFCKIGGIDHNDPHKKIIPTCKNKLKTAIPEHWENLCRSKRIISSKVIRYDDPVALLNQNFVKNDVNFRIIYLVRDPRAVISSQYKWELQSKNIDEKKIRKSALELKERYQSVLEVDSDKMLTIRYEDFVNETPKYLDHIYNFLNLNNIADTKERELNFQAFENVKKQIFINTHAELDKKSILDNWGTEARDGLQVISGWTNRMSFETIEMIQNLIGSDIFEGLGYRVIADEGQFERILRSIESSSELALSGTIDQLIDLDFFTKLPKPNGI